MHTYAACSESGDSTVQRPRVEGAETDQGGHHQQSAQVHAVGGEDPVDAHDSGGEAQHQDDRQVGDEYFIADDDGARREEQPVRSPVAANAARSAVRFWAFSSITPASSPCAA